MMAKKNIVLLSVGICVAALMAVAGVLLFRGIHGLNAVNRELARCRGELAGLYALDPFPSAENVARERDNVKSLQEWFRTIYAELREGQITSDGLTKMPPVFMNQIEKARNALVARAGGTGFDFGFEYYVKTGVPPKSPETVPRMTQQLMIIEKLCGVLFDSGVDRIVRISRDEVEMGSGAAAAHAGSAAEKRRAPRGAQGGKAAPTIPAGRKAQTDFPRLTFHLEFEAGEKAAWKALNALAAHRLFIMVKAVEMKRQQDGVAEIPGWKEAREGGGETASEMEDRFEYKDSRVVSGPHLESPLHVKAALVVYEFPEEQME